MRQPFCFAKKLRELFHPAEAVAFDHGGDAFEHLIRVEAGNDRHGMPMENEGREEGKRQNDAPDADQIHAEYVFCITAAADDTRIRRHLVGRSDAGDRKDDQKAVGKCFGFFADFIGRNDRRAEKEQRDARENADADEDQLHGFCILLRFLDFAFSDRFADDDGGRTRATHGGYLQQLE